MSDKLTVPSNSMLQASKTFPEIEGLEKELLKSKIAGEVNYAIESQDTVQFKSDPGVGKTSFVKYYCKGRALKVCHIHAPTTDPDLLSVAIPQAAVDGTKVLHPSVVADLQEADVVLIDELCRAKKTVENNVMEMIQNKTIGGQPLKENVTFILADNTASQGGVQNVSKDLAFQSRITTVELLPKDVPWEIALGAKFEDTDLTQVFKSYNTLEHRYPGVLKHLSPRTLEHVLWNMLHGLPGELGLPLLAGPRAWLMTKDNENVTDAILDEFAQALGVQRVTNTPSIAKKAITLAIEHGVNAMLQGSPGIGKTEYTKQMVRESGMPFTYWSMQNVSPDEHVVPFPDENRLRLMLSDVVQPLDGKEYVLIADEFYRAPAPVMNMMLEVTQGGTFGGQEVPLRAVIAMTNPRMIAGQKQNVGRPDRAQADRFFINVDLQDEDIPANDWMLETYGDVASPFIEWWKEDLDDLGRLYIPKRVLERMIKRYQHFSSTDALECARPYLNDEYVNVSLHDLKQRLANRPVARLKAILKDKDDYISRMEEKTSSGMNADQEAHITVSKAINSAEYTELKEAEGDLVELLVPMDRALQQGMILGTVEKRQNLLSTVIMKANKLRKAKAKK